MVTTIIKIASAAFKRVFIRIFLVALFLFLQSLESEAQSHECLKEIELIFDGISEPEGVDFCSNFREGWRFHINPFGGHLTRNGDGTFHQIFNMRQPSFQIGQSNNLEFELILEYPDVPNLYRIHTRVANSRYDQDRTYSDTGTNELFLWGLDTRQSLGNFGPYGSTWNPSRVISCLIATNACSARYNVIICNSYRFPNFPERNPSREGGFDMPIIFVSTEDDQAREDLLHNFHIAHSLIEETLERILEHSCHQRERIQ